MEAGASGSDAALAANPGDSPIDYFDIDAFLDDCKFPVRCNFVHSGWENLQPPSKPLAAVPLQRKHRF